jgi:hypothetical protein
MKNKQTRLYILQTLLIFSFSLNSALSFAVESHVAQSDSTQAPKEAFKIDIEKNNVIILKSELGPYEYLSLSVNGKIYNEKKPTLEIFELIERDAKNAGLNNTQKNKLSEEVLKMQLEKLEDSKNKDDFAKRILQRGRLNGYYDSEKRAYLSLGLKIYSEARIIQPYRGEI